MGGGITGGQEPGSNGGWGREKRGREAGYPRGTGAGRSGKNFATLAQYFAVGKSHRSGYRYGRGRGPGVQGARGGKFKTPCPPPPHSRIVLGENGRTSNRCSLNNLSSLRTK